MFTKEFVTDFHVNVKKGEEIYPKEHLFKINLMVQGSMKTIYDFKGSN